MCTDPQDDGGAYDFFQKGGIREAIKQMQQQQRQCLQVTDYGWHHHMETEDGTTTIHDHQLPDPRSEICTSLDGTTRYIFSNGVPNHRINMIPKRPTFCPLSIAVSLPARPVYDESYLQENPILGPLGFTTDGIPLEDAAWAVTHGVMFTDDFWSGHPHYSQHYWHYHSSKFPPNGEYPASDELVGYAMDGKKLMTCIIGHVYMRCAQIFLTNTLISRAYRLSNLRSIRGIYGSFG